MNEKEKNIFDYIVGSDGNIIVCRKGDSKFIEHCRIVFIGNFHVGIKYPTESGVQDVAPELVNGTSGLQLLIGIIEETEKERLKQ